MSARCCAIATRGPVSGLPLSVHIVRPDAIEVEKRAIALDSASGGTFDFHVPDNAYSGAWRIWASAGDKSEIGSVSVSVQDFVPPRLEAKLSVPAGPMTADGAIEATVAADYFYGSPGADLSGQVEATLQPATNPFKGFESFSFGLVQEPFLPKALSAQEFTTDDKGRASVVLQADEVPDTTVPLEVALHATVNDVDGRPGRGRGDQGPADGDAIHRARRDLRRGARGTRRTPRSTSSCSTARASRSAARA